MTLKSWKWTLAVSVAAVVAAGLIQEVRMNQREHRAVVALGEALFNGRVELAGRITGQGDVLPTAATRCGNCHATQAVAPRQPDMKAALAGEAAPPETGYAPSLNRAALTSLQSRRGGPPTRYDKDSLCALVRGGVDAAHIILPQSMPRYDMSDSQCAALWEYLISE